MRTSINTWLEKALETGAVDEQQIIVIYDKNNNIEYFGKADFAPLTLWDDFKTAVTVGNELHINERQCETGKSEDTTEEQRISNEKVVTMYELGAKSVFYKNEYNWLKLHNAAVDRDVDHMNAYLTENTILNPLT